MLPRDRRSAASLGSGKNSSDGSRCLSYNFSPGYLPTTTYLHHLYQPCDGTSQSDRIRTAAAAAEVPIVSYIGAYLSTHSGTVFISADRPCVLLICYRGQAPFCRQKSTDFTVSCTACQTRISTLVRVDIARCRVENFVARRRKESSTP